MTSESDDFIPQFEPEDGEQQPSSSQPQPPQQSENPYGNATSEGVQVRIYFPPGAKPDPNKTRPQALPPLQPASEQGSIRYEDPTPLPRSTRTFDPVSVPPEPPPLVRSPDVTQTVKARREGCSRILLMLIATAFICLLVGGSLAAWAYFTNSLPSDVVAQVETAAAEQGINIQIVQTLQTAPSRTTVPTATTTAGAGFVPTVPPTETPTFTIPVTVFPPTTSPDAGDTTSATPQTPANQGSEEAITQYGISMVYVAGGSFSMGSDRGADNEQPVHEVTLDPYYIDQYEVTNASYALCVEEDGCATPRNTLAYDSTPYYGVDTYDDYPVVYVSWDNAEAYCEWRGARLPSEAEWEMAARWNPETGAVTAYPWGDEWDPARLNYCDSGCLVAEALDPTFDDGYPQMAPVGSFPTGASAVGAYDMAGNVAEWVFDWYARDFYASSPETNPNGPETGRFRVVRDGGWSLDRFGNRSTARLPWVPRTMVAGIGFRCAISADAVNP